MTTEARTWLGGVTAWLAAAPTRRFRLTAFGLYALHVTTGLAAHTMWRDELQAWLIARDSASPLELARNLAYEGHPALWYLLIWPLHFLSRDPVWIQAAQGACALGAMGLLLWRGPFSRFELALTALSYPFLFEYAVVSRSYALGDLLLFAFCAAFAARLPALALATLLALLVNVHAMFGLIALGGLAAVVARRLHEEGWRSVLRAAEVPAAVVLLIGAVAAVAVARPRVDSGFATAWGFDFDAGHVRQTAAALGALFTGAPGWGPLAHAAPYLALLLVALIVLRAAKSPPAAAFFSVAVVALIAFMHAKGLTNPWHSALLFVVLVATVWLARGREGPRGPCPAPAFALAAVLLAQAWAGLHFALADRFVPYSAARETARLLSKAGLGAAPVFALSDFEASGVVAYLGAPTFFYGRGMRDGSFVVWDKARLAPLNVAAVVDRAAAAPGAVVLDCEMAAPSGPPPDPRLAEWGRALGKTESCVIYRLKT